MSAAKIGLGVAAGYLLGRTKKFKLAITVGSMLAGQRVATNPQALMKQLGELAEKNPEFAKLQDRIKGELFTAAKSAAISLASNRLDSANKALTSPRRRDADDEQDDYEDEQAPEEGEEPEEDEEPEDEYEDEEPEDEAEEDEESEDEEAEEDEEPEDEEDEEDEEPADEYEDEEPEDEAEEDEEPEDEAEEERSLTRTRTRSLRKTRPTSPRTNTRTMRLISPRTSRRTTNPNSPRTRMTKNR